jgi:hypothetical protein
MPPGVAGMPLPGVVSTPRAAAGGTLLAAGEGTTLAAAAAVVGNPQPAGVGTLLEVGGSPLAAAAAGTPRLAGEGRQLLEDLKLLLGGTQPVGRAAAGGIHTAAAAAAVAEGRVPAEVGSKQHNRSSTCSLSLRLPQLKVVLSVCYFMPEDTV